MARISSKHQAIQSFRVDPVEGLNLSQPAHAISDQELTEAYNMVFLPHNGVIATRPAFVYVSDPITPTNDGITNMHQFRDWIICSCKNDKLYAYDVAAKTFDEITTLTPGAVASMITFNDKLIIADGGYLRSWDGTTVEDLNQLMPSVVVEIGSRVCINDTSDPDAIYLSAPENETDWDTNGNAIGLRAGYGDGMEVNGLAVMGADLIVSKVGKGNAFLYRLNTGGDPANWKVSKLISDTASDNVFTISSLPNAVMYLNSDGELRTVTGVQQYGDIRMMNIGEKVNPGLNRLQRDGFNPTHLKYLSSQDMLACIFNGRVYAYYHANQRFTYFDSLNMGVRVDCCTDFKDEPYWGGDNGRIYRWEDNASVDTISDGLTARFESKLRSKLFVVPGEAIIKKSHLSYNNLAAGIASVLINNTTIKHLLLLNAVWYLYDANIDLFDANMDLYSGGTAGDIITIRNRVRVHDFYVEIRVTAGRIGINYFDATFALVNG